ncbi:rab11 family-interacting protein 1 [Neolamprologus brichardi]|uniref:rab11 family-interacting protein 1 n=1 Tax=Neolamprologus brichardi TaxID=32507 RepID=UPI001643CEBC|nr:rab11 family-interacting protein 1 [Neolamprologus brichardi]
MSLADQSQQSYPTSVQVTVHQARNLRTKGKNGTNDSYAIIQVAKDKFSTAVAEKSVDPVWKEEASFDLPLFHPGNAERCMLYIIVMHRAQVGLDKFLGQAVINLLQLYDNKARKKTEWFKLVDKTGKEDKARGEVLLDIQFMRNNMSASMFDLSMQDKPRSRISKIKDKVRGKKKDGFSDSASAIVPSVSQVLTDSEGEADAQSLNQSPDEKKKSKLKKLFAPKSNLQRNISQSMSTLGTLPEKNSSLSGSRSSGLNVNSPDVKKKFKLGHKRTGSSDSKVSLGPFSLLGRSKQSNSDLNNLCINGSHVYTEETEPKSGSTLSLNSSGRGSVEDVRKHTSDLSADAFRSVSVPSTDRASQEQQHHQEEEERRQAEERRIAEAKRIEEEEKHRAQLKRLQEEEERRLQEEQERKRRFLEDEARRKKQMPPSSPRGNTENLSSGSEGSSPTMADQNRRALLPPTYRSQTRGNLTPVREIQNPAYEEPEEPQPGKTSVPLPDYETLFPQRRHGVKGQPRWDNIIAEVNQKHKGAPVLLGPEMSVDGPLEHTPSPRSSVSLETPNMRLSQAKPQETKPVSTKKAPAPTPPKPVTSPLPRSAADSSQKQSPSVSQQSSVTRSQPASPASVISDTSSRVTSGDGARKVLQPSPTPSPRTPSQMDLNTPPSSDQSKEQATMNKEAPTAKPRQRVSVNELTKEQQSAVNGNIPKVSNSSMSSTDKKLKDGFAEEDPFPSTQLLSRDPWTLQKENGDSLFTGDASRKEATPRDWGMTANDFDKVFGQEKTPDPFTSFNGSDLKKQSEYRKTDDESVLDSPAFQRKNSQKGKKSLPSTTPTQQIIPTATQGFRDIPLLLPNDGKTQSSFSEGEDLFGDRSFFQASEPLQVVMEEPEILSGGKETLRTMVSPSEVQPVSTQNSNGSGLAINSRRPHPVKPMSTSESQGIHAMKEIKVRDSTPAKTKVLSYWYNVLARKHR